MRYKEGTCPHCRGLLKEEHGYGWSYICTQCRRCWIILDKIYWLAGFSAGGEIYKIDKGELEEVREFDPLWEQLWDRVRNPK